MSKVLMRSLILVLALFAAVQARSIKVGYLPDIGFSPLMIAEAKGYWKDQGIKVELVAFDNSQAQAKALGNGEIDLASDMMGNFVGWEMAGAPIKLAAETHWSNGSLKLLMKSGQDIHKLKGQQAGVGEKQISELFLLSRYLNANGMTLADMRLTELSGERLTAGFIKGQVPVAVLPDPYANDAVREGGGVVIVDTATYQGIVTEGFAVNTASLAAIPDEQWVKFYRGWLMATAWLRGPNFKWGEYRDLLNAKTFKQFSTQGDAGMMDMFGGIRFHGVYDAIKRHGELGGLEYHVRDVLRFMKENGISKTEPEPRTLIQSEAFERALKSMK